jgi:hypothetical protein
MEYLAININPYGNTKKLEIAKKLLFHMINYLKQEDIVATNTQICNIPRLNGRRSKQFNLMKIKRAERGGSR